MSENKFDPGVLFPKRDSVVRLKGNIESLIAEIVYLEDREEYAKLFASSPELLRFVRDIARTGCRGECGEGDTQGECEACAAEKLLRRIGL